MGDKRPRNGVPVGEEYQPGARHPLPEPKHTRNAWIFVALVFSVLVLLCVLGLFLRFN